MQSDIFGAVLAFAAGVALAAVNYLISRRVLKKAPDKYVAAHVAEQTVQVLFLVALFVFGDRTGWDRLWLTAGGCLGVTVPMIWFTRRLVRLNDSLHRKEDSGNG